MIVSDKPKNTADTWLYLRASEAGSSPNKNRTMVQIHDLFDGGLYGISGSRRAVKDCAAICFTHGDQKRILQSNDIDIHGKSLLIMPLGAGEQFTVRKKLPKRFTVAWIGRPVQYQGRDFKRTDWFVDALEASPIKDEVSVLLMGDRLQELNRRFTESSIDSHYYSRSKIPYSKYPDIYQQIDCVAVTSEFAAGPNCLYESLASGVSVIATRCGWAEQLIEEGENGFLVDSPASMATAIENIYINRDDWFARRHAIKSSLEGYSLETWLNKNIQMTAELVKGSEVKVIEAAL